jgi:hypothetical protein
MEFQRLKADEKIINASRIFEIQLSSQIVTKEIDLEENKLKIQLRDGSVIYIQYNNHDQYSYHIVFSNAELDRCRFDNYDAHWNVKTKPHHFHPRNSNKVDQSPMNGTPMHDLKELISLLRTGRLFSRDKR